MPLSKFLRFSTATVLTTSFTCVAAQILQPELITKGLFNEFLDSRARPALKVGQHFPSYEFLNQQGKRENLKGKRTLLFVRGAQCGSCDMIVNQHNAALKKMGVQVFSVVTAMDSKGFPTVAYGKLFDETSSPQDVRVSIPPGKIGRLLGRSSAPAIVLVDEKSIVRYVSYGFWGLRLDARLGQVITGLSKPLKNTDKGIALGDRLSGYTWRNSAIASLARETSHKAASVVIVTDMNCTACSTVEPEIIEFVKSVRKQGFGAHLITVTPNSKNSLMVSDPEMEWLGAFKVRLVPQAFILKKDTFAGEISYFAQSNDPQSFSSSSFQRAVIQALNYVKSK